MRAVRRIFVLGISLSLLAGTLNVVWADSPGPLVLTREGRALVKIVLNTEEAIPAEVTAAEELQTYLGKITGAKFQVVGEAKLLPGFAAIYLGDTALARDAGINISQLGPEESILRTVGGNLILTGGRPRGTLYAVYELLEKVLGCRWYTPWAEKVPSLPACTIPPLDERLQPYFMYRANYNTLGDQRCFTDHESWVRFVTRNRLNGDTKGEEFGGYIQRGRAGNHSFAQLVPTDEYFEDHPEYFSMREGKRVPSTSVNGNHLCLTNPEVLRIVIEEAKKDIENYPQAFYISVSINDGGSKTICDCPKCRAVAEREGEAGLVLQFVNAVADAIRDEYPDKYLLTLAYNPTGDPPRRLRARDNVIVFVCRGGRTALCYFPKGREAREFQTLREWSQFASHVWVWDYANAIYRGMHFFRPVTWQMYDQFQLYRELDTVDGIFQENEFLGGNDVMFTQFYEMNLWVFAHLCQDPAQSLNILMNDFLRGYYGPAGAPLRRYLNLLETRRYKYPFRMFDWEFVRQAQDCFDRAQAAVADHPELLARVQDLRINLDMATLAWRNEIIEDYFRQGGRLEDYPFKLDVVGARLLDRIETTRHGYILANVPHWEQQEDETWKLWWEPALNGLRKYAETLASGKEFAPLPEQFRDLPPERVIDLPACEWGNNSSLGPYLEPDPGAALGLAIPWPGVDHLPMPIATYTLTGDAPDRAEHVQAEDIPGPGYHWYRGSRFKLGEWTYVYLTESWRLQQHLYALYDPANPDQEWEVWVSMKCTGPDYPHGNPNDPNGVYFDRMILVRIEDGEASLLD